MQVLTLLVLLPAPGIAQGGSDEAPVPVATTPGERPGLLRAGAWYFTPYFQIGSLGVDTNVFYTATDRQTDFTGLEG